jgi:putative hemolysin
MTLRSSLEKITDSTINPEDRFNELNLFVGKYPFLNRFLKISDFCSAIKYVEPTIEKQGGIRASGMLLDYFDVNLQLIGKENIPKEGNAIYVANHPWGVIDGLALINAIGTVLDQYGSSFKIIGTEVLRLIKRMDDICFFINNKIKKENFMINAPVIKNEISYLDSGGSIGLFPAASTYSFSRGKMGDSPWKKSLGKLVVHTDRTVPLWFTGPKNGFLYSLTSSVLPSYRSIFMLREALNKRGETIMLNIGEPISREDLLDMSCCQRTEFLRKKCEALQG